MNDVQTHESTLALPDGHALYTKTWSPSTPPNARLVWLHGFSDHCNWYDALFRQLAAEYKIKTFSFDQRGWGRSVHKPSQRGLSGDTAAVVRDVDSFVKSVVDAGVKDGQDGVPLFLGGHSMGGAEALTWMVRGERSLASRVRGVVLESPFLAQPPESKANAVVVALGRAASRFLPGRQMVQKLDKTFMCRDPEVCDAWEKDELCHDTGTLEGLRGLLERGSDLTDSRVVVTEGLGEGGKTRVWIGHGTGDKVADFGAVKKWIEGLEVQDKELVALEGGYHKLHSEPEGMGQKFAEGMGRWILERAGAGGGGEERRMGSRVGPKL